MSDSKASESAPVGNVDEEWTSEKNARRFALIEKKHDGSITPEETNELVTLTNEMRSHVDKLVPDASEDELLLQKLLRKKSREGE